jgi:transposase-like protein
MSKQRKITDELDAQRCLAAARKSGEKVGSWARANGIDGRSLNTWRMNLERRGSGRPARSRRPPSALGTLPRAAIVELVPSTKPTAGGRYLVHVGSVHVEIGDDFDPGTLRRIVEALRVC